MKLMVLKIALLPVMILFLQHGRKGSACSYSAIYSFGDSLADTGNSLSAAVATGVNRSQLNFGNLPYGKTYFGKATGRFSDERLTIDYIGLYFEPFEK